MDSFESLPLGPEIVAALAAEGIETPTPFQAAAIPVIARGKDLMGRAGAGSGTLVAWGAPLVERLQGGHGSPVCAVICPGSRQATGLARSLASLCHASDLRAAALAPHWNLPEHADFLFVPASRLAALYDGTVHCDHLAAIVLHDGDGVIRNVPRDRLEAWLTGLPQGCQRIFCGLPFGDELRSLARRFSQRAVTIPPGSPPERSRRRGSRTLKLVVAEGDPDEAILARSAELLGSGDARHVLLFAGSADRAADLGDLLALHGYHSGAPGDDSVPVWLCPGDEEAAAAAFLSEMPLAAQVATISCGAPAGREAATRRHGQGGDGWVLCPIRELAHIRQVAADAGFAIKRIKPERTERVSAALDKLADRVHETVRDPAITPYYLLVESLLDRFSAAEVAATTLLLLDRETGATRAAARKPTGKIPESWTRLFVSAGERDEIGPRELLGAIVSESGVMANRVGRIDVRESHSLVEVRESDAQTVIGALNGITLGGRALRVDYDRPRERRPNRGPGGPAGGRPGGGRPSGGRPSGGRPGGRPGGGRPGGGRPGSDRPGHRGKPGGRPGSRPPFRPRPPTRG